MKKLINKQNGFILLMIISTLALAGSAAYYSVIGLSSLFAGARNEVIIMAGALEFSKLIIASYLHNHWNKAGWMKWYLTMAVAVLMVITSAGIYGFLTSAYQTTADKLGVVSKQTEVIELKKGRFEEQLTYYNDEKSKLTESITSLRNGLSNNKVQYTDTKGNLITTTSSSQRKSLESQVSSAVSQRDVISIKIESLTDSITKLELQVLDLETNNEVAAEVGPLRYMSEITGKPMNTIVNWFTLLIVFVFDPLALSMVIALNKLTTKTKKEDDELRLNFDINNTNGNDSGHGGSDWDTNNETTKRKVSKLQVELGEVGTANEKQTKSTDSKEVSPQTEAPKKETPKKEKITFIPTDEDAARLLYGEKRKQKHTYTDVLKRS